MATNVDEKYTFTKDESDPLKDKYGVLPFIQSKSDPEHRFQVKFTPISSINKDLDGQNVKLRVRLQRSRIKGKSGFLVLREGVYTIQACLFVEEGKISKQMVDFAKSLRLESYVDVTATVKKVEKPVESCTQKDVELAIETLFLVASAPKVLPFQMEDALRKVNPELEEDDYQQKKKEEPKEEKKEEGKEEPKEEKKEEGKEEPKEEGKESKEDKKKKKKEKKEKKQKEKEEKKEKEKLEIVVKMNTRLDNRVLDLRVPTTQAIFKLQSGVAHLFREYLDSKDFIEIHSPKLVGGASEGGADVFKFKYFNQDACLAQSPQLYKQMCIISDFKRVYEIGPVFRAEKSFTSRHLCEFTGLDIEMEIKEHYFEVLDILGELFYHIFNGLNKKYAKEIEIVNNQYPFEPLVLTPEVLKLSWKEGVQLLSENGFKQDINEDLDTENEKSLGRLVKEKYKTDFYILYGYPKSARPFYTMPDPNDDNFTNSFDAFIRGEEVLSGAQRIHDYDLLLQKVKEKGVNPETLADYLNAFKLGAPAHGGAGIGLERVVKLFVGLGNIKKCVLFPRDPKRLKP
jgi:aspartyl-tRNA synthetase